VSDNIVFECEPIDGPYVRYDQKLSDRPVPGVRVHVTVNSYPWRHFDIVEWNGFADPDTRFRQAAGDVADLCGFSREYVEFDRSDLTGRRFFAILESNFYV
jgi:hypothetical protein